MPEISIKIVNFDKVIFGVGALQKQIPWTISSSLVELAKEIKDEMQRSMENTPKTGRHYFKSGKLHIASSPGQPPARDSGSLLDKSLEIDDRTKAVKSNIVSKVLRLEDQTGEVEVGSTIFYAPFLEKGTRFRGVSPGIGKRGQPLKGKRRKGGKKMEARPFLKPAVDKSIPKFKIQLTNLVASSLRKISV